MVSLALPYFHGPGWRAITGGKPLCMRCGTWEDVLAYMLQEFGERWQEDELLVDEWRD
ncbi:MAG: hypothetical protein PHQ19_10105 [Candidatus Krumholzibacteria bacterium]|nr:hypothetical protein [Candidatus Krumholzibacteria bacterium]